MLGSNERKKIIEEEDAKALAEAQGGKSAPSGLKSKKKKKSSPAQLEATQCSPVKAKLVGDKWEIIPAASQKFSVPAMPKTAAPAVEEHRPKLREGEDQGT